MSRSRKPSTSSTLSSPLVALALVFALAGTVTTAEDSCRADTSASPATTTMKAVVVGGTGAVGREIVLQLLASDRWQTVTTVGRRPLDAADAARDSTAANARGLPAAAFQKLTHVQAPDITDLPASAFANADAVFCALGTTRGDAGSAEAFLRVDLHGVEAAVRAAKAASGAAPPRFFGLVSASGANAALPAPHFVGLHPLLYSQTKGAAEEAVRAAGFESASAYRPGLLSRGAKARTIEKVLAFVPVVPRIAVADVARVAVADAERCLGSGGGAGGGGSARGWRVYDMLSLMSAARKDPAVAPK